MSFEFKELEGIKELYQKVRKFYSVYNRGNELLKSVKLLMDHPVKVNNRFVANRFLEVNNRFAANRFVASRLSPIGLSALLLLLSEFV